MSSWYTQDCCFRPATAPQEPTEGCKATLAPGEDDELAEEVPLDSSSDLSVDSGEIRDQQEVQVTINYPAFQRNRKPEDQSPGAAGKDVNSHPRVILLRNLQVTTENDVLKSISWNEEDDIRTIKEKLYKKAILQKGTDKISFPHIKGNPLDHIGE